MHAFYHEAADASAVARKGVEAAISLDLYCGGAVTEYSIKTAPPPRKRKK